MSINRILLSRAMDEAEGVTEQFGATTGVNVGKAGYLLDLAKL